MPDQFNITCTTDRIRALCALMAVGVRPTACQVLTACRPILGDRLWDCLKRDDGTAPPWTVEAFDDTFDAAM